MTRIVQYEVYLFLKETGGRQLTHAQYGLGRQLLLLSTLPVRHWKVYTEGIAYTRCLPIAIGT